jgi:hypothetical protein
MSLPEFARKCVSEEVALTQPVVVAKPGLKLGRQSPRCSTPSTHCRPRHRHLVQAAVATPQGQLEAATNAHRPQSLAMLTQLAGEAPVAAAKARRRAATGALVTRSMLTNGFLAPRQPIMR